MSVQDSVSPLSAPAQSAIDGAVGTLSNLELDHTTTAGLPSRCRDVLDAAFAEDFGTFLTAENMVEQLALDRARRAALAAGERFDHVLTKLGLISETSLAHALSKYLSIPLVLPNQTPPEPLLYDIVDADFIRRNRVIPLSANNDLVIVGVTDPFNNEPVRALGFLADRRVITRIFPPREYEKAFEALYSTSALAPQETGQGIGAVGASENDVQRLRDLASEAPIIRLVNQIITSAVESNASDIHLEPGADAVLVRQRIDGRLRSAQILSQNIRAAVTSRIKIMSKLDIAERRMPQDGRIKLAIRGIDIDFRVSTIPTAFGESVVMRILDRSRVELDFTKLGFHRGHISALEGFLEQPNGIVLVTGPTGSGKTTTLYTALKALNNTERKIFTVEDPIEYQLPGINQVQVQSTTGLTFPHSLRSILRQDPDIIMIGEIRDLETARIAIQASLTGHLVLSTLHTNNAAATITRLIDMGVENYLLSSTLRGLVAQRLVRRLCPHCSCRDARASFWVDEFLKTARGLEELGSPDIRQASGCLECGGTGFASRTTIAELLSVDAEVQRLVLSKAADTEIESAARERGMRTMYEDGVLKVWRGETTAEEVLRATRMT